MIKITADSTCDLSPELLAKYDISLASLHVLINEEDYLDGVNITPKDIFHYVSVENKSCSTAAINTYEYEQFFKPYTKQYEAIIHISLGSEFSSCHQNACLAAQSFENIIVIDSQNLSTGSGLLVLEAAELAAQGYTAKEIEARILAQVPEIEASFVIDKMDYLKRGGRCSSVEAFGATLLKIKPSIEVTHGKMEVGKKYRGQFASSLEKYVKDRLENRTDIDLSRIFITHPDCPDELVEQVKTMIQRQMQFDEILITNAGCTVSTHCGPSTLGILFKRTIK
ncbi:DegV family protein [Solibacillus sp. MA9]|uniref:DegV family protein n=1 Tax=Solibacillus palustris TaxID=2908203 RepID=A0ABS9UCA6_9BACL|nr:DegV family protein [Solibacillus sp. MA9]MCH7321981.1 DegV family protein [Solibacillus sp. MA9]